MAAATRTTTRKKPTNSRINSGVRGAPYFPCGGAAPGVYPARGSDSAAVVVSGAGLEDGSPGERLNHGGGGSVRLSVWFFVVWVVAVGVANGESFCLNSIRQEIETNRHNVGKQLTNLSILLHAGSSATRTGDVREVF